MLARETRRAARMLWRPKGWRRAANSGRDASESFSGVGQVCRHCQRNGFATAVVH